MKAKEPNVKLFGAEWCAKTSNLRNYLQSRWIDFDYYDVESDEKAADELRALFNGKLKFPTVTIDEVVLKNPSISELRNEMGDKR